MKKITFLFFLFSLSKLSGQRIEKFYDYNHKESTVENARFYSVKLKTDSGWFRQDYYIQDLKLQMRGTYEDSSLKIGNGQFIYVYSNQKIKQIGKMIHGKKEGIWLTFHPNGYLSDSTVYKSGNPIGVSFGWHDNGVLRDSTKYEPDGRSTKVIWFDNGVLSSAGRYNEKGKETGVWIYNRKDGKLAAKEIYEEGKIKNRIYYDLAGNPEKDTSNRDANATFKGGVKELMNYLGKHLVFPEAYKIIHTNQVTILVNFTIDETGVLKIIEHSIPFKTPFDNEVDRVLKKMPLWTPGISHNRNITQYFNLPVTFINAKED